VTEDRASRALPSVTLRPIDHAHARAIILGSPCAGDTWAAGYPTEGDVEAAGMALKVDPGSGGSPFCCYELLDAAERTIGGAGFHGPPADDGVVEIGYGIAPSTRRLGFARAAIVELVAIAAANGARRVTARTALGNLASQHALEHVGFVVDRIDGVFSHHVRDCAIGPSQTG
jgi:RimJ/RimL family protein N-acetyltransferase